MANIALIFLIGMSNVENRKRFSVNNVGHVVILFIFSFDSKPHEGKEHVGFAQHSSPSIWHTVADTQEAFHK